MRISRLRLRLSTVKRNWTICASCGRKIKLGERFLNLEWGYTPAQGAEDAGIPIPAYYSRRAHVCLTCGPKGVRNPKLQDKAGNLTEKGIAQGRDKVLLLRIRQRCEAAELTYRQRQAKRFARLVKV